MLAQYTLGCGSDWISFECSAHMNYSAVGMRRGFRQRREKIKEEIMSYLFRLSCLIALLVFTGIAADTSSAHAGVATPSTAIDFSDVREQPLVQKVHGCHRRPRIGPWTGKRHRHVGPFCIWKKTRNPCKRWRRICRERCYDARRPGRCKRRCFTNNAPAFCF